MMKRKIIFATSNEGKMKEVRSILEDLGMEVLSMKEAGIQADVVEDGTTFEENAVVKAVEIQKICGEIVLADDSGLEVDYLNKEISKYITGAVTHETTRSGSQIFNSLYKICSNIERVSDHAINIADYSGMIAEKKIVFSAQAQKEIVELQKICDKLFMVLLEKGDDVIGWHEKIACMEQKMDDVTALYRNNMFARIQAGICSDEGSILFSEMLTDFERIGDHALNISKEMVNISMNER